MRYKADRITGDLRLISTFAALPNSHRSENPQSPLASSFAGNLLECARHTTFGLAMLPLLRLLLAALLLSVTLPAGAEETQSPLEAAKQAVKDGKQAIKAGAQAVGDATRDTTKAVGHESRDVVHRIGDAIKDAWNDLTGPSESKPK